MEIEEWLAEMRRGTSNRFITVDFRDPDRSDTPVYPKSVFGTTQREYLYSREVVEDNTNEALKDFIDRAMEDAMNYPIDLDHDGC